MSSDHKEGPNVRTHVDSIEDPRITELARLEKSWIKYPHLIKLNALLVVPLVASYMVGYDGSMMNGMQSVPRWQEDFNYPRGALLGLLANAQLLGGAISIPFAPWFTDTFGRRHPIFAGSVLLIVGAVIQGMAKNIGMFIAGKVIIGFAGNFVSNPAGPLIAELAHPHQRPVITALYNTSWYLGAIVAAWVTYGTFRMPSAWSWRIPSLLQAAPSILQCLAIYLVPESPRWLASKSRFEEAEKILCKYHIGSDTPDELVIWELAEIRTALEHEEEQKSASYMHFFRTKGNRHRFLICSLLGFIVQWSGNGLVSYYLIPVLVSIGITNPETQNLINGMLSIFNYITSICAAFLVDRIGRRKLFLASTTGMALSFVIWTAVSAKNEQADFRNSGLGIGVVVMIFAFFFFYNIAMNPVPVAYMLEILPFTLRAKGLTVFNFMQTAAIIFNGFVNPVALEAITWRYYIVFACLVVVWMVLIYFFFPETRNRTLEEVTVIFDGHEALDIALDRLPVKTKIDE